MDGPAAFTPGLKPITPADWLSPDTEAAHWLNDKRLLIKLMRDKVSGGDLNGPAAEELLPLVMKAVDDTPNQKMPTALEEAASLVTDDICILEEEARGDWRLIAGVVCAPTYWTLPERLGLDLGGLHAPVPEGDPQLSGRISRIFNGLKSGAILQRFNWTVQAGDKRHTPTRPETSGKAPADLFLRVERQTIRKLPKTGAIVFTIRICMDPLLPALRDPNVRERFEDAWLGASIKVRAYKGWNDLEGLVSIACREADQAAY